MLVSAIHLLKGLLEKVIEKDRHMDERREECSAGEGSRSLTPTSKRPAHNQLADSR